MCDLICDVIMHLVCLKLYDSGKNQCNLYDKIVTKYGIKRQFYINLHLKDCLGMELTACYGADIIYRICDSYRYFAGQA